MSHSVFSMFDMAIVGVPVISFCIWQLISVNREIGRDRKASEESARHPVGEHGLDDRGGEAP